MNRLLDLRFVIGLFFLIVGVLLIIYSYFTPKDQQYIMINGLCGALFTMFGIMMIWLSRNKKE
jgi:uncharacterized membrane protein HdeD (DUF308 family)